MLNCGPLPNVIELVDSICRDGTDTTYLFFHIEWRRTPKHSSYMPFWTHTRTLSKCVSEPAKTLKVRKVDSYNDLWKLAKLHFWIGRMYSLDGTTGHSFDPKLIVRMRQPCLRVYESSWITFDLPSTIAIAGQTLSSSATLESPSNLASLLCQHQTLGRRGKH